MKNQTLTKLLVVSLSVCISATALANGLVGKHYLGASVISQNWGDPAMDSLLGRSTGGQLDANYNLADNWDLTGMYRGLWDSYDMTTTNTVKVDAEVHMAMGGLNYLIPNSSPVTPYFGGQIGAVIYKDDIAHQSDTAFSTELGAEWDICKDAFLNLAVYYLYVDNDSPDNDDYGAALQTGVQVIENLMLVGSLSYSPENYDSTASIGLVIHQ